jgi:hypothetical protein
VDWEINGLFFDDLAHMHLPEKPTNWQRRRAAATGLLVMVLFGGCFLVGFIVTIRWLLSCLHWK